MYLYWWCVEIGKNSNLMRTNWVRTVKLLRTRQNPNPNISALSLKWSTYFLVKSAFYFYFEESWSEASSLCQTLMVPVTTKCAWELLGILGTCVITTSWIIYWSKVCVIMCSFPSLLLSIALGFVLCITCRLIKLLLNFTFKCRIFQND